jgi:hypothetical protein
MLFRWGLESPTVRLCRLMCGKSLTFRLAVLHAPGLRPDRGLPPFNTTYVNTQRLLVYRTFRPDPGTRPVIQPFLLSVHAQDSGECNSLFASGRSR